MGFANYKIFGQPGEWHVEHDGQVVTLTKPRNPPSRPQPQPHRWPFARAMKSRSQLPALEVRPRRPRAHQHKVTVGAVTKPDHLSERVWSDPIRTLLEATLSEEKKTDDMLTKLAESDVNQHA